MFIIYISYKRFVAISVIHINSHQHLFNKNLNPDIILSLKLVKLNEFHKKMNSKYL